MLGISSLGEKLLLLRRKSLKFLLGREGVSIRNSRIGREVA